MSIEEAFLRDILSSPDEDAPRLVYADWLDEHGGEDDRPRAALIRAQCELERLADGDKRRKPRQREIAGLLKEHGETWTKPLADAKIGQDWEFRRGFLEKLTISARAFVPVAAQLFQLAPMVRAITFPDASNEVEDLADCPELANLREIDLDRMCACGGCRIDRELRYLFASPQVANLTFLRVSRDRIDAEVAGALAAAPHLRNLRSLDLSGNPLGLEGVQAILSSTAFPRLTTLDLSSVPLQTSDIQALAKTPVPASLSTLSLCSNRIGVQGVRALAASPHLARLTTLNLRSNRVGDAGAEALAASPHLAGLQVLDLRENEINDEAARSLRRRMGKRVKVSRSPST